jgi:hypothetical protein
LSEKPITVNLDYLHLGEISTNALAFHEKAGRCQPRSSFSFGRMAEVFWPARGMVKAERSEFISLVSESAKRLRVGRIK